MDNIYNIREMELYDCEKIEFNFENEFDNFWNISILKNELHLENRKYFLIETENGIIGFIGIMINDNNIEIMNIVVKKTERKKGYGRLLLGNIIDYYNKNNYKKIFLEVSENNENAISLYIKSGFKQIGKRKKYYDNKFDALIMCYEGFN